MRQRPTRSLTIVATLAPLLLAALVGERSARAAEEHDQQHEPHKQDAKAVDAATKPAETSKSKAKATGPAAASTTAKGEDGKAAISPIRARAIAEHELKPDLAREAAEGGGESAPKNKTERRPRAPIPSCTAAELPPTLSALALRDELARLQVRLDELKKRERDVTAAREALAAERLDLDLQRQELSEWRPPAPTDDDEDKGAKGKGKGKDKDRQDKQGKPGAQAPELASARASFDRAEVARLSSTVKAMRAPKAAAIVEKLDPALATELLRGIGKGPAAQILEELKPELSAELLRRLSIPPPPDEPADEAQEADDGASGSNAKNPKDVDAGPAPAAQATAPSGTEKAG